MIVLSKSKNAITGGSVTCLLYLMSVLFHNGKFNKSHRLLDEARYRKTDMSDQDDVNRQSAIEDIQKVPGCGLASYSCLLLIMFLMGIVGLASSSLALFQASFQREPFAFVPGNQVEVWRLQPMRDAKLLGLTEVPDFYHDESRSGDSACALTAEALLRLDNGESWKIPFSDIQSVSYSRDGDLEVATVLTVTEERLSCLFASGEGVTRFVREVRDRL